MIKKIFTHSNTKVTKQWKDLLEKQSIRPEKAIDETFGLFEDGMMVATASRYQNIIKCVAVDSDYQGGSAFNQIVSHVVTRNSEHNFFKNYVYTTPESVKAFERLGFMGIEQVDNSLVFMEKALTGFNSFIDRLKEKKVETGAVASIVMNANPFTFGHLYLIETASKENDIVHLFVLSEEMSPITSDVRFELVQKGVAHLENVVLHITENYMVSNATFPSYFLKETDDITSIHARLDARIFAHHIAPALGINRRYVGNEPHSNATNIYNSSLQKELKGKVDLVIIERLTQNKNVISASKVRQLMIENQLDEILKYVPRSTYDFFKSPMGEQIIEELRENQHEHP